MYIKDDICYAGNAEEVTAIAKAKVVAPYMFLVTFDTGEERLFDVQTLTQAIYEPLKDINTCNDFAINYGTLTWLDSSIDIAPETLYNLSIPYSSHTI